jgi:uncharacterized membrane protein
MLLHSVMLGAFYNFGQKLGPILTWVFILLMVVVFSYAMIKYVFSAPAADTNTNNRTDLNNSSNRTDRVA